jgi:hypothetical protein
MNCAITLWHVHDWLWQEREAAWRAQGIADKGVFQTWLKARDGRDRLTLCERLANGSKHFRLNKASPVDASTYVSESDVPDSKSRENSERLAAGERFAAWSLDAASARDVLMLVTTDGHYIRADNLFEATIDLWESLFDEVGINKGLC